MTRHGTLAYYLAAWVIGCFVASSLYFYPPLPGTNPIRLLLAMYAFSLMFGAVTILTFAFLLRAAMRLVGTHLLLLWFLAGAVLSFAEISLLRFLLPFILTQPRVFGGYVTGFVFTPAAVFSDRHIWQVPIDGAITGLVLCLVDRAFAGGDKAVEPGHSVA